MEQENYFYEDDEKTIIKVELLTSEADECAKNFKNDKLSPAQIRRFYNEAKLLESKVKSKGFDKVMPIFKMLKSKIAYNAKRQQKEKYGKIVEDPYKNFMPFMNKLIDNTNTKEDFEAFLKVFEATLGFFIFHSPKKE